MECIKEIDISTVLANNINLSNKYKDNDFNVLLKKKTKQHIKSKNYLKNNIKNIINQKNNNTNNEQYITSEFKLEEFSCLQYMPEFNLLIIGSDLGNIFFYECFKNNYIYNKNNLKLIDNISNNLNNKIYNKNRSNIKDINLSNNNYHKMKITSITNTKNKKGSNILFVGSEDGVLSIWEIEKENVKLNISSNSNSNITNTKLNYSKNKREAFNYIDNNLFNNFKLEKKFIENVSSSEFNELLKLSNIYLDKEINNKQTFDSLRYNNTFNDNSVKSSLINTKKFDYNINPKLITLINIKEILKVDNKRYFSILSISFSCKYQMYFIGAEDNNIYAFKMESNSLIYINKYHKHYVTRLFLIEDYSIKNIYSNNTYYLDIKEKTPSFKLDVLVSGSIDGEICIWNIDPYLLERNELLNCDEEKLRLIYKINSTNIYNNNYNNIESNNNIVINNLNNNNKLKFIDSENIIKMMYLVYIECSDYITNDNLSIDSDFENKKYNQLNLYIVQCLSNTVFNIIDIRKDYIIKRFKTSYHLLCVTYNKYYDKLIFGTKEKTIISYDFKYLIKMQNKNSSNRSVEKLNIKKVEDNDILDNNNNNNNNNNNSIILFNIENLHSTSLNKKNKLLSNEINYKITSEDAKVDYKAITKIIINE